LENKRRRDESYALYGGLVVFAIVMFIIYRQRRRSDKLLLNILPLSIAKRLKAKEHPIADHFENASVVFIDIVGFTSYSAERDSNQIVNYLNVIFTKFDEIAAKYKLEKIKTIGDGYMAVSGIPIADKDHAKNMAGFALEVRTQMKNYHTEDNTTIRFRLGIDCGEVVAGIIGEQKFIYDLWGDTVNTAARMESNGTPDEIQVTERFKETLENDFLFEERGEMNIKGKGIMKTFYLKGEKKIRNKLTTLLILIFGFSITYQSYAAEFDLGADVMNRYVWRGRDYGNSPKYSALYGIQNCRFINWNLGSFQF
jgi:class 3 adenylate cyclase